MNIEKLTITFEEGEKNLDLVAELIDWARANNKLTETDGKDQELSDKKVQKKEEPVVAKEPEVITEPEAKEEEVAEEEPVVTSLTIEDIREVFVEKNNIRGNTAKLKAILTEFKVKKVTDLEEKDFEVVMAKLKEL